MLRYATGAADGSSSVGGLVGRNDGTISASYATGAAGGSSSVGGLVGYNNGGTISAGYATGAADGSSAVGGLVGFNNGGTISVSYATGNADVRNQVGGLVGFNSGGTISASYFDSDASNRPAADSYSKTTSELQSPTSYAGIYANWNVDVDNGLAIGVDDATMPGDATADIRGTLGQEEWPALRVDFNGDGSATWEEFGNQVRSTLLSISPSGASRRDHYHHRYGLFYLAGQSDR